MPHSDDCLCGRSQLFTFCADVPKPEFWFGDAVSFHWSDEETGEAFSETGEVVGAVWNFSDKQWQYIVTWVSSNAYPTDGYPIFDGDFRTAGELCKTL